MNYKYVKPLKDDTCIKKFFQNNGVSLTDTFETFFKENNGGRPSLNICLLQNGSEKVVNNFLSFNEEDKENVYKAKRRTEEDNKKLLPFAKDPAGNYFCLLDGAVVFYSHEDGAVFKAAESFESFIGKLQ